MFITNSKNNITLKERIQKIVGRSEELKILVGFFYFSGWQEIYKSLKENKEITLKILVGLQVDKYLSGIVEVENKDYTLSNEEHFSEFIKSMGNAINNPEMDIEEFYKQIEFFVELIETNRLEIKKTLNPNHAKLYLFKYNQKEAVFNEKPGRFITGSSNFTKAGLKGQEEFNVEIADYGYEKADEFFEYLWHNAIPITEAPNGKKIIIDFLKNKSITSNVTPYEAYAYILKTFLEVQDFSKNTEFTEDILKKAGFDVFKYQVHAVNQALGYVEQNSGVIIADVVGLGKSVIASAVAKQLKKRGLILCPPGLIGNEKEKTGWWEYKSKFELWDWDIKSTGKIEEIAEIVLQNPNRYEVVIIDEAHKFRNEDTSAYEALSEICRGKQVILLTATPFNNSPADIFSLLKLFTIPGQSTITFDNDLEALFSAYNYRFKRLSYITKNHNSQKLENFKKAEKYYTEVLGKKPPIDLELVKAHVAEMANDIKNTISSVTIRINRLDLREDYEYKKEIKTLSEIKDPKELFFELSSLQSDFYDRILTKYFSEDGEFSGAIYTPYRYETKPKKKDDEQSNRTKLQQTNLFDFMRRLLVKRFESSFGAFEKSIDRFLKVHKMVKVFIEKSGRYVLDRKVLEGIYDAENEDFVLEEIERALEEFELNAVDKTSPKHTKIYEIDKFEFKNKFLKEIDKDIKLFEKLQIEMNALNLVNDDPKRRAVLQEVEKILSDKGKPVRKVIIFTEYTDTVRHLKKYFEDNLNGKVMFCDGNISKKFATKLDANFNAKNKKQKNDFDVLVTSDKLSEGFNLNRAGLIINYDIPWNPTRVIQRVGRINRIGTKVFDELFIYNFFPTEQGANVVRSREIASQKMFLIHNALGEDAKIFAADEEPTPSGLFKKVNSNTREDEELNIVTIVRNEYHKITENHPEIIERIKELPNRTKTAKAFDKENTVVLRRKGLSLFSIFAQQTAEEVNVEIKSFPELFENVKCDYNEPKLNLSNNFWSKYEKIKTYKIKHKTGGKGKSLETEALSSLKSLLKVKRADLDQQTVSFINTLLKDLKKYKTLSTYTLRKLVLPKNKNNVFDILIENIKQLRAKLGDNYLEKTLQKNVNIEDDIIIAVDNIRIEKK